MEDKLNNAYETFILIYGEKPKIIIVHKLELEKIIEDFLCTYGKENISGKTYYFGVRIIGSDNVEHEEIIMH